MTGGAAGIQQHRFPRDLPRHRCRGRQPGSDQPALVDSGIRILFCDNALLPTARNAIATLDRNLDVIEIALPRGAADITHEDPIAGSRDVLRHRKGAPASSLGLIYTSGTTAPTTFPLDVGDLGYVDDEGHLFLTGRSSEVIISGGVNIYPAEIEAAAMELPYVEDAAAVGKPHEGDLGEQVALFVVARPGMMVRPLELLDDLSDRLAPYKLPRVIEVLNQLPRDENGKVYKSRL